MRKFVVWINSVKPNNNILPNTKMPNNEGSFFSFLSPFLRLLYLIGYAAYFKLAAPHAEQPTRRIQIALFSLSLPTSLSLSLSACVKANNVRVELLSFLHSEGD